MEEKKLTDKEILKALDICTTEKCEEMDYGDNLADCPLRNEKYCVRKLTKNAIDLIHRLQDENTELQKQVDELEQLLLITKTNKSIEQKKTVKEYAEKLKLRLFEYADNDVSYDEFCKANVVCDEIDDICKEQYGVEVE